MELNELFEKAVVASRSLNLIPASKIDSILLAVADAAEARTDYILEANRRDLALMDESNPMYDRLMLTASGFVNAS
jgi:glutamate-5-semialdehyde dehydrogenase